MIISDSDNIAREANLICQTLIKEIGRASTWSHAVEAFKSILHVRLLEEDMKEESRRHC